jgi:hypothetical protein
MLSKGPTNGGYDPLNTMRPGPLAPEYIPERKSKLDYEKSAFHFIKEELDRLKTAHVIFESTRKFGRFDVENGRIVLGPDECEADYTESLSKLWQIGDGYVYIREKEIGLLPEDKYIYRISVFHINHNNYVKLASLDAADLIKADPLWTQYCLEGELHFP